MFIAPILLLHNANKGLFYSVLFSSILDSVQQTCRSLTPHCDKLLVFLIQVDIQSTQRHPETPMNVAGFHFPSKVRVGRSCQPSGRRAVRNVFSLCVCIFRNLRTARMSNRRRRKRRRRTRPTATSSTASSSGGSRCRPSMTSCWVYW